MDFFNEKRDYLLFKQKKDSVELFEVVKSINKEYVFKLKTCRGWRASHIKSFIYQLNSSKRTQESRDRLIEVAMFFASNIRNASELNRICDILYSISEEECSFWEWKCVTNSKKATKAFKALYGD